MRKVALLCLIGIVLVSCTGQVMTAANVTQALKRGYEDPDLAQLDVKYSPLLQDLYARYTRTQVDIYPAGLGFVSLKDGFGKKYRYLLVQVRPREAVFSEEKTKGPDRFNAVMQRYYSQNFKLLKPEDIDRPDIDGVAFAVFWSVRDFSQCDTYGGFIEYAQIYLRKQDALDVLQGQMSLLEAAEGGEVIVSLDLKPAVSVRMVEKKQ